MSCLSSRGSMPLWAQRLMKALRISVMVSLFWIPAWVATVLRTLLKPVCPRGWSLGLRNRWGYRQRGLSRALEEGRLGYAGLDVFEREPLPPASPLRSLDPVVLSDHTGYYSEESLVELKTKAAQNVAAVLKGGRPLYPVNQLPL